MDPSRPPAVIQAASAQPYGCAIWLRTSIVGSPIICHAAPCMLTMRDVEIATERAQGRPLKALATEHGITHQRIAQIARHSVTRLVDKLELQLMVARKTGQPVAGLI